MSVQLNHTIIWSHDKQRSATFLTEVLGLPEPKPFGPFLVVELSNGVSLDFYEIDLFRCSDRLFVPTNRPTSATPSANGRS